MHQTTVLSQKGQVVLPKALRDACRWNPGTRLTVRETPEGLLLTAAAPIKTREARSVAHDCSNGRRFATFEPNRALTPAFICNEQDARELDRSGSNFCTNFNSSHDAMLRNAGPF